MTVGVLGQAREIQLDVGSIVGVSCSLLAMSRLLNQICVQCSGARIKTPGASGRAMRSRSQASQEIPLPAENHANLPVELDRKSVV